MNIRNVIVSGLAAVALATVSTRAQEIDGPAGGVAGYNSGDLILAFYSSSGANDLLFDIGSAASYTGLGAGTYSVAEFNGSATAGQPAVGSGNSDYLTNFTSYSANTRWTVAGANGGTSQLWISSTGPSSIQKAQTSSIQGSTAGSIDNIGFEASGNPNIGPPAGANPGDSLLNDKPVFNSIGSSAGHTWSAGEQVADSTTASPSSLTLWQLNPTTSGTRNGVDLGTFTLVGGVLDFTVTAIPEPSTYAAILGALTVGFVMIRRRFRSAGLSVLA